MKVFYGKNPNTGDMEPNVDWKFIQSGPTGWGVGYAVGSPHPASVQEYNNAKAAGMVIVDVPDPPAQGNGGGTTGLVHVGPGGMSRYTGNGDGSDLGGGFSITIADILDLLELAPEGWDAFGAMPELVIKDQAGGYLPPAQLEQNIAAYHVAVNRRTQDFKKQSFAMKAIQKVLTKLSGSNLRIRLG